MKIEVYSVSYCPYCRAALSFFEEKGLEYKLIDLSSDAELKEKMKAKFNWPTVPIIVIDDKVIGGFADLQAAVSNGSITF